ncbi:GMC family oxidoreductase [Bradyrhizobium symbiodeficiens]|uniref:GMC family oxidoreductase n=1 Tax=Bradyrhizobium symbiodeficiens TaxID=1404367 RepID=UPI0030D2CB03
MMNNSISAMSSDTGSDTLSAAGDHDAIVVGGGATGGLAATLLTEAGLRVLLLDAGPPPSLFRAPIRQLTGKLVRQLSTPQSMQLMPGPLIPIAQRGLRRLARGRQWIQSQCYAWERSPDLFVDDVDCPYVTAAGKPFNWVRVRGLGGRVGVPGHGRQYYRLGPDDFDPPDGLSASWPLRPGELDPWYDLVERRLGLVGRRDGLPWLPDSEIAHEVTLTPAEVALRDRIVHQWPAANVIPGRNAPPLRSLAAAAESGRLHCRRGAIASKVHVDGQGNVCGVSWIDHRTGVEQRSSAPLVFLCASALESTRLLLLSRTPGHPEGLGGKSGVLGRYLMDHVSVTADGTAPMAPDSLSVEDGRCLFLPRFDARNSGGPPRGRGFGVQLFQFPVAGGRSYFVAGSFAEMLPRRENRVTLDPSRRDAWGIPVLAIDCAYGDAEMGRGRDQTAALRELARIAQVDLNSIDESPRPPGSAFHECGTARMGRDPAESVLDANNECWDARGLYVTDGACFPSQGYQNPTLTMLALTARACRHALAKSARDLSVTNTAPD